MNLNPDKKNISEIFPLELDVTYNVPIYQRNFAWKEEHIETLINDINNEDRGYYLGNFIVTEHPENKNLFDIIDGQQRITTIALIYLAIHQLTGEYEKSEGISTSFIKLIGSLQDKIKEKLLNTNREPQLDLLSPDKEIYDDLLEILKDDDDPSKNYKPHKNRILGMRFDFTREYLRSLFFKDDIDSTVESIERGLGDLDSFYDDLNSAEILRIRVQNLNDAFTIFTSFNAKGVPLTLIDLFKSFFLKESDGNLSEEEAMGRWEELISIFYNENNEPISSVVTQFLLNNYDTFESDTLSSITQNSALDVYEVLFSEKGFEYIDTLIHRAKVFSNINGKIEAVDMFEFEDNTKKMLAKLDRLSITQVYPLVLYALHEYHEERITEPLLQNLLNFLIKFYVRRNIILKPKSSNIRARSLRGLRKFQEVEMIEITKVNEVKESLKSIAASDEEFKTSLAGPLYTISKNTTRMMLIDIERASGTFFNNQVRDNLDNYSENGKFIWTLEHIMPQSADTNEHWRQVLAEDVDNNDQIPILLEQNVHKIGNLTLTGYNSEMSAKPFVDKRDYRDSDTNVETGLRTELFINSSIPEEGQNINEKEEWKLEDIERRTNFLIDKILPIYQFS